MQKVFVSSTLSVLLYPSIRWAVRIQTVGENQTTNAQKALEMRIPVRVVEGRSGVAAIARLLPHTTHYVSQRHEKRIRNNNRKYTSRRKKHAKLVKHVMFLKSVFFTIPQHTLGS